MRFSQLDDRMRIYEEHDDRCVLPEMYVVARLDGRGFTKLTKDLNFEKPFDPIFRHVMIETTKHLMESCGFSVTFGYTQSDEISLLLSQTDQQFNGKIRKLISVLAGEASAKFTQLLGAATPMYSRGSFDCRISELPTTERVVDYFSWRSADSLRNSLNGWAYWTLRKAGLSASAASSKLNKATISEKNQILLDRNINFNDVPGWQKRGIGLKWEKYKKEGFNPLTGETVLVERTRIAVDLNLPLTRFDEYIRSEVLGQKTAVEV